MTTFEITEITLLAIIALLLFCLFVYMCWHFRTVEGCQKRTFNEVARIHTNTSACSQYMEHHITPDLKMASTDVPVIREYLNNIQQQLDNIHQRQPHIDWDKLSKEQQDEFLKRLICPDYDKPFSPFPPCYANDGICTNPHRDCVNCPKQYGGGVYTTATTGIKTTNNDK